MKRDDAALWIGLAVLAVILFQGQNLNPTDTYSGQLAALGVPLPDNTPPTVVGGDSNQPVTTLPGESVILSPLPQGGTC